jgi:hypothetical protein
VHAVAPAQPAAHIDWIDLGAGRFALRADQPVALAAEVELEQKLASGTFAPVVLDVALPLAGDCAPRAARASCRTLTTGELVLPGAWDGSSCAGPCCPATPADPRHSGTFRWVVSGCPTSGGSGSAPALSARSPSPDFALPSGYRALYRSRAAAHLRGASVARIDALSADDGATPSPDRIAGHATLGAEVQLDEPLVGELSQWLSGPGFEDDVLRRCKRADAFGFRGVRRAPGVDLEEDTEIAIDLHCSSIAVIYREGAIRRRMDAFFDPSRAIILSILERALPGAR